MLVDALLPDSDEFVCVTKGPDGRDVLQCPLLPAWIYTWRLVSTFTDLTMWLQ